MSPAAGASGCVGYVIGKKQLARSVDRNYVRRMLREIVRARRPRLDGVDVVLRLRKGCARELLRGLGNEAGVLLDRMMADQVR